MSDPQHRQPGPDDTSRDEAIREHEHLDAETVIDDIGELFEPDNDEQIPPPSPDTPPP